MACGTVSTLALRERLLRAAILRAAAHLRLLVGALAGPIEEGAPEGSGQGSQAAYNTLRPKKKARACRGHSAAERRRRSP